MIIAHTQQIYVKKVPLITSLFINSHVQLLIQVTMEVQRVPEKRNEGFTELMKSNRRLKNQVISLQGNVKEKKIN